MFYTDELFPKNWSLSIFVDPSLNIHCFENKQSELLVEYIEPRSNKKKSESAPTLRQSDTESLVPGISAGESADILMEKTGLHHLRVYKSYNSMYLFFDDYNIYFKINQEILSNVIAKIFFDLKLPFGYRSKPYLDEVASCAVFHPSVTYLNHPRLDIKHDLVSIPNKKILSIKTGKVIEELRPDLFVVNQCSDVEI